MDKIRIEKAQTSKPKPDMSKVAFGTVFTDNMFICDYKHEKGWLDPRIVPFGPFTISPASQVLNYAPEIFEGLKAYRTPAGKIQLFRPTENIKRMANSAERMCLPQMDPELFMEALKELVTIDQDWVPSEFGTSLYIRPIEFANDEHLGVKTPKDCIFTIILSPVGSYFKEGINPVKMMIEKEDVRAVRGGTGFAKCGGNYACSLRAGEHAAQQGFAQVLWLDAIEKKYIEEGGGMNVMFKIAGKVVTPKLNGSILPGITRKSILEIMEHENIPHEECLISIDELRDAARKGTLEECFCCGTAAVIGPIGELDLGDEKFVINDFKTGPIAQKLYDTLTGIQWGRTPDPYGWTVPVC
jgi:branched-chain amino acid aminotransferase